MKIRTKFFLIFSVLAIIPLFIITWFSYSRYEGTTYQRMDEISANIFQNAVTETNNTLDSIRQSINFLTFYSNEGADSIVETLKPFAKEKTDVTSYEILKANQYCKSVFQNIMISNEQIHGIHIFTKSGVVFSLSLQQNSNLRTDYVPEKQDWYQDTLKLEGKFYISPVSNHEMFGGKKSSVFFAKSLKDVYTHKFLGIILIDCSPEIFDLSNVNTLSDTTLLSITNKETNATLYSNIDELPKDFSKARREVKKADLSLPSLELTAVFNYDKLYREFNLTGVLMVVIAITCAFVYIILSYLMTKNLVRPLECLSGTMSKQDSHDFTFSSPYMNRTDEIGTLYNEYGNMLEELNASIKRDYQDKMIILDAQMKSLEARINSHFLFNTLESINSIAELDENEQIATMSLSLGNMFRYSIKTQSELVTLQEELHHVSDYVSIQSIRFSNRFQLKLTIPNELKEQKVLKLILQPLVENALYHGLDYCTKGDLIGIEAWRDGSTLYIGVSDNGQGITVPRLEEINQKLQEEATFTELGHRNKQSIGLKNIHTRIELYYGKGYGLHISSLSGEGTTITIRLPILQ